MLGCYDINLRQFAVGYSCKRGTLPPMEGYSHESSVRMSFVTDGSADVCELSASTACPQSVLRASVDFHGRTNATRRVLHAHMVSKRFHRDPLLSNSGIVRLFRLIRCASSEYEQSAYAPELSGMR